MNTSLRLLAATLLLATAAVSAETDPVPSAGKKTAVSAKGQKTKTGRKAVSKNGKKASSKTNVSAKPARSVATGPVPTVAAEPVETAESAFRLEPADAPSSVRIRAGASFRGGMKLNARGAGSRAAGAVGTSSRSSGTAATGTDSSSADLSFGYTGGDRTFGSGTTALGSGTIHADGTYSGGDYSAVNDDVYFSDNRTTTETVGGKTTTKTTSASAGGLAWRDDDLDGPGVRLEADVPLFEPWKGAELAAVAGVRGWWGIEGETAGSGVGVNYRTTTTTSGGSVKTTASFYDVTAPLNLDGTLDLANATVFQGNTVTYVPADGSSSNRRSTAFSAAKIEAEADLWQVALGTSLRFGRDRLSVSLRPVLLLNWIELEATRTEVLATADGRVTGSWADKADDGKFAVGAGVDLSVECALDEAWSVWVAGGYEWVDAVEFGVGPQKVELDPSAWTVSAGICFSF